MSTKHRNCGPPGGLKDLGNGLLLRRAGRRDAEAVAAFNARVHHPSGGPFERREPQQKIAALTRDLTSGGRPACDASDFTVVEDARTNSIVPRRA